MRIIYYTVDRQQTLSDIQQQTAPRLRESAILRLITKDKNINTILNIVRQYSAVALIE